MDCKGEGRDTATINGSTARTGTGAGNLNDLTVPEGLSRHTVRGLKTGLQTVPYDFLVYRHPFSGDLTGATPSSRNIPLSELAVMTGVSLSAGTYVNRNPDLGGRFQHLRETPVSFSSQNVLYSILLGLESSITITALLASQVSALEVDGVRQTITGSTTKRSTFTVNIPPAGRRMTMHLETAQDSRNYEFNFVRS